MFFRRYIRPIHFSHAQTLESRVLLSGDLDPTFGFGGLAQAPAVNVQSSTYSRAVASVQSDGKILSIVQVSNNGSSSLEAIRFLPDGSLDSSFGDDGIAVVGSTNYPNFIGQTATGTIFADSQSAIYEMNSDGEINSAFGAGGSVQFPASELLSTGAVDGNDILVGDDINGTTTGEFRRFLSNGSVDSSFGNDGVVAVPAGISSLLVTPAGKILVLAGSTIYQFNNDGSADLLFGQNGHSAAPNAVAILPELGPSGQIYVSTGASNSNGSYIDTVYRLATNGSPDSSFATISTTDDTFAVEPDGSVLSTQGFINSTITHYTSAGVADGSGDKLAITATQLLPPTGGS